MSANVSPGAPSSTSIDERSGLQKVMWFGVLQLVGLVSGWIGAFFFVENVIAGLTPASLGPNPTPSQVSAAIGPLFRGLSLLVPIVAAIQIVAVLALVIAFRQLKRVDNRFSVPATLSILLLIGALLAIAGAVPLFYIFPGLISQVPSTPGVPAGLAAAFASLVLYFLLIAVGGILSLIGLIGGQILGLWRAGSKYGETLLKLGGIFTVIPLLNVVAPILVIIGAHQAKGRIPAQA